MKLNPQIIKIDLEIITPIHIDNGDIYDRLDYFYFEGWEEIQILDRKWLNFCAKKDLNLFKKIILAIEKGDFIELEDLKNEFYTKYIDIFFEKYGIINEIKIGENAGNFLIQTGNKKNNGEIKRFSNFGINNNNIIAGSTLKGIFRTIFLFDELKKVNHLNYKERVKKIENIDKNEEFKKNLFAFLQFEDVKIENSKFEIQEIKQLQKPKKFGKTKKGISQILEMAISGKFEIIIKDIKGQININDLKQKIENYSNILIVREEQILDNIKFNSDFLDLLDDKYNSGIIPIKIGMFKRSNAYKIFWEEMIKNLPKGKDYLKESRKLGVGDKTIYIDEDKNPIGWVGIKKIEILNN